MIILKHNVLSVDDLFLIERQLLRWLDRKETKVGLDFNVLTLGRADIYGHLLGIFTRLGCTDALNITHSELLDFFIDVDAAYLNAPYHSFYHAVDIVFMIYYMLTDLNAGACIPPLDIAALLIAALCHDIGHPGYNNVYQVNFKTDAAKKYNNTSVLEALSCELVRDLILKKHVNIVHSLVPGTAKSRWMNKIETMILHTDMIYHYTLQEQAGLLEEDMLCQQQQHSYSSNDYFSHHESSALPPTHTFATTSQWAHVSNNGFSFSPQCYGPDASDYFQTAAATATTTTTVTTSHSIIDRNTPLNEDQIEQFSSILLHAADISNTVRPWAISKQWSDLIVQEFFRQGDIEKRYGLAVSPGMDRDLSSQADISLTFGDLVVRPYFEAFAHLLPGAHVFLQALDNNRDEWIQIKQNQDYHENDDDNSVDKTNDLLLSSSQHQQRQFPVSLLPIPAATAQQFSAPPLGERRVSVAAGTLVIPENVVGFHGRNGSIPCRAGLRSQSFAVAERTSVLRKLSHGPVFLQQRATTGYDIIK
ncbi:hypothetical protein BCR42DRAFT_367532 [Absidia repens]|uniref:Phosphodiesterase n=1 Tax=Absidia repens TaxID=90262 RepID=A0A1X2IXA1_9FUNG|nr:hypothetical protein BCR42DRAFT_367532 [Absidia repens]